jgi:hypothetical protein
MRKGRDSLGVERWGHLEGGSYYAAMLALMTDVIRCPTRIEVICDIRMERGAHARWQAELYEAALSGQNEEATHG